MEQYSENKTSGELTHNIPACHIPSHNFLSHFSVPSGNNVF